LHEQLELLLRLQEIDSSLTDLEWEAEDLPRRIADLEQQIEMTNAVMKEQEVALETATKDRRKLEDDLEDTNVKLDDLKSKQVVIKTNEEYAALQTEIQYAKNTISQIEDSILVLLEQIEGASGDLEAARQSAADSRGVIEKEIAQLERELGRLTETLTIERDKRVRVAMNVDERMLERYERILESKGDQAVVPLVDGFCTGCYKKLPAQQAIEIRRSDRFFECDGCGRILYWRGEGKNGEE
jgi:predicted  nucleic acid-binding Zn-ribbon protein